MKIFAAIVTTSLVFVVAGCSDSKPLTSKSVQAENLKRIESETGLVVPALSKVVEFSDPEPAIDPTWVAKIVVPEQSYPQFKASVLNKQTLNASVGKDMADSTSWWKPKYIDLAKQYLADQHTFVKVVSSKDNGEWTIYIECAVF